MPKYFYTVFFISMFIVPDGFAVGDQEAGKQKAQICAACHAADGNSINPIWPKLAGQHAEYISKQLQDYQAGNRKNDQMSPMATNLGEQDITDLSAYFASQKIKHGTTDPSLLELGEKIYRAGNIDAGVPACLACHGPTGRGNPAALYPALGGQHAAYTQVQLKAFRENTRINDINEVMRTIVGRMTDEEIKAVSEYVQGLH